MKTFISFIKKHEDIIVCASIFVGVFSFIFSIVLLWCGNYTAEEIEFIFSLGLVAFAVGGCAPLLWVSFND